MMSFATESFSLLFSQANLMGFDFNTSLVFILSMQWVPACIVLVSISINLLVCQQNCCISRIVFSGKATSKFA